MARKDSAFLIFGDQLNKIIACLHVLMERNVNNVGLRDFVEQLETLRPYEEMLDEYIDQRLFEEKTKSMRPDSMEDMLNDLGLTLRRDNDETN
jgi:hypothetical protein|tara:strand:+ start:171 stop:449 length:279 start_codon:yes stop_codon:yes gene_type:complete